MQIDAEKHRQPFTLRQQLRCHRPTESGMVAGSSDRPAAPTWTRFTGRWMRTSACVCTEWSRDTWVPVPGLIYRLSLVLSRFFEIFWITFPEWIWLNKKLPDRFLFMPSPKKKYQNFKNKTQLENPLTIFRNYWNLIKMTEMSRYLWGPNFKEL